MDTLVLEGKEFISTKRAAEITGYAKDYIGQLCREGRVESRLIGRNWYILEASIREHRYGNEETKAVAESFDEDVVEEDNFEEPEEAAPIENEPIPEEILEEAVPIDVMEESQGDSEAIEEIQRAWQSWFSNRYVEETPVTLELLKERPSIAPREAKEEVEHIQPRDEEAASIRIGRLSERAVLHQVLPSHETVSMRRGHRAVPPQEAHREVRERVQTSRSDRRAPARGRLILKSFCIAVAGLSLAVAIIGTGALDSISVTNTLQAQAMKYIGGTISF